MRYENKDHPSKTTRVKYKLVYVTQHKMVHGENERHPGNEKKYFYPSKDFAIDFNRDKKGSCPLPDLLTSNTIHTSNFSILQFLLFARASLSKSCFNCNFKMTSYTFLSITEYLRLFFSRYSVLLSYNSRYKFASIKTDIRTCVTVFKNHKLCVFQTEFCLPTQTSLHCVPITVSARGIILSPLESMGVLLPTST